jgi:hypothetical protein
MVRDLRNVMYATTTLRRILRNGLYERSRAAHLTTRCAGDQLAPTPCAWPCVVERLDTVLLQLDHAITSSTRKKNLNHQERLPLHYPSN